MLFTRIRGRLWIDKENFSTWEDREASYRGYYLALFLAKVIDGQYFHAGMVRTGTRSVAAAISSSILTAEGNFGRCIRFTNASFIHNRRVGLPRANRGGGGFWKLACRTEQVGENQGGSKTDMIESWLARAGSPGRRRTGIFRDPSKCTHVS